MEGAGDSVAGMYADQLTDALLLGPEGSLPLRPLRGAA